ncbi:uncharacterized protein [Aquarana catesbeiana]|uniref:uncharacterized protein n=1 Tax=Aquarana catesbeiana TaxID=8400 RepID=UPI003CC9B1F6
MFQHFVNDIFRDHLDNFLIVYLDDILLFSATLDIHRVHMKKVLTILRTHGLYVKAKKSDFEKETIYFLGLVISTKGVAMDPQKVKAILDWPAPSDKKGIQRFIGFSNFYRRFIKNFSAIIAPITQLTRLHSRFQWSPEAQTAFDRLKTVFVSAPVLQHPDPTLPYVL